MLTTIGDKIIEIRPKQIIESNTEIKNDYLVLVSSPPRPRGRPKKDERSSDTTKHTKTETKRIRD